MVELDDSKGAAEWKCGESFGAACAGARNYAVRRFAIRKRLKEALAKLAVERNVVSIGPRAGAICSQRRTRVRPLAIRLYGIA